MEKVSIIIPTLNEERYIETTLKSIKPQLKKGDEIIIVDSYSKDSTIEICKKYTKKIYNMKPKGIGPAKTFGAKKAKNNILIFPDGDSKIEKNFLKKVKESFSNEDIDILGGCVKFDSNKKINKKFYDYCNAVTFYIQKSTYKFLGKSWFNGNCSAIRKDVFLENGGFKDVICEDFEFGIKNTKYLNMAFDKKLNVILSDRRYKEEGFINTTLLWTKSIIMILLNKEIKTDEYKVLN